MFKLCKIGNKCGLTLVETTIALGILMMGILVSLTLMLSSFNYIQQAEHEIVVVNLTREGIEIIRAIRNQQDVDLFDAGGSYDNRNFFVDVDVSSAFGLSVVNEVTGIDNASQCDSCKLYLNNGKYIHDDSGPGTTETIFKRIIKINPVIGVINEKVIISEVSWTVKGKTYDYSLEAHLTDWQ